MPDIRDLLRDAYTCAQCPMEHGFCTSPNGGYFKFPPVIGATSKADLLFIGINPRRSKTNLALHDALMRSKRDFMNLALNRVKKTPYIHTGGQERHYHDHLKVISQVYGQPQPFESCAAVTELFLCATTTSAKLPRPESECAESFLPKVLQLVQPKAIVAVGSRVMAYLCTKMPQTIASDSMRIALFGNDYKVVSMPHPANPRISSTDRARQITKCARTLRTILGR